MNETVLQLPDPVLIDELSMLKQRATMMGIAFSNNIGIDTLRAKISIKMEGKDEPIEAVVAEGVATQANPLSVAPARLKLTTREHLYKAYMRLVRLRITNLDPKKKDLPGEVFTLANSYLGTVRKYIPYGEVTDQGYHVPWCIYQELESRRFLNIRTAPARNGSQVHVSTGWAKEFSLEVLPPLTQVELQQLATAQQAAGVFES